MGDSGDSEVARNDAATRDRADPSGLQHWNVFTLTGVLRLLSM
jgi:hypothetical protein